MCEIFRLGKSEMISYYKGTTIPTSHIHMFDPENVTLACNIFRELVRWELANEIKLLTVLRIRIQDPGSAPF